MLVGAEGVGQAYGRSYLSGREVIEGKGHQNNFTLNHEKVSRRQGYRYLLPGL